MDVGGGDRKLMSEINVTPLVDVMLVLLIIFMVAAPMMMQGMDVQLPQTQSKAIPSQDERLVITLNKKQEIYINEYRVSRQELQEKLKILYQNKREGEIFLRADRSLPYGFVVQIMSDIKNSGIEKLGMVTEPGEEKK
ncbi:MAG: protein TolR [Deltaproteobacteria bacterium RBG_13_43_22]|nr:MAG: protein TolR [Deltaproteobacteria bacterium RBG_13_43_22]